MAHQSVALVDVPFVDEVDRGVKLIIHIGKGDLILFSGRYNSERLHQLEFHTGGIEISHHTDHQVLSGKRALMQLLLILPGDVIERLILHRPAEYRVFAVDQPYELTVGDLRSEERRVGKGGRRRWAVGRGT